MKGLSFQVAMLARCLYLTTGSRSKRRCRDSLQNLELFAESRRLEDDIRRIWGTGLTSEYVEYKIGEIATIVRDSKTSNGHISMAISVDYSKDMSVNPTMYLLRIS